MVSLKHFPFTLFLLVVISYLSFFKPPSTGMDEIPYMDKFVHIGMYAALSGTIWLEYLYHYRTRFRLRQIFYLGIIAPVLISGAIELGQAYLTTNRSGDWFDFLANITGVILAALIGYYVVRPRMK